jgi:tRNA A37 threonylcarbamoyladenosine synthetase subunit TsaC/SUA5/YrdC
VTGAGVADALDTVLDPLDVLLDCGAVTGGPPSTIVEMAESGPRLVRAGAIAWNRVLESIE